MKIKLIIEATFEVNGNPVKESVIAAVHDSMREMAAQGVPLAMTADDGNDAPNVFIDNRSTVIVKEAQ